MTLLQEVLDVDELIQLIKDGYVSERHHPESEAYSIFNYTNRAVGIEWTETLRECRGLIVNFNQGVGTVLARSFAKFFNSTEPQSSWLADTPHDTFTVAMDKSDGSLGIAYMAPDGLPAIATRGSFTSDQALHATALLRSKYPSFRLVEGITDLFEVIFSENRIVLDYGDMDDLVHLGHRYIDSGQTIPRRHGYNVSPNWIGPVAEVLYKGALSGSLALGDRENREGMVLYVLDEVTSMYKLTKVKQADYVALHRIVTGLNERVVWEELKEGRIDALISNLPAEHAAWANKVVEVLLFNINSILDYANYHVRQHVGEDKKTFAMWAKDQQHSAALFAAFSGNTEKLKDYAWKQIKPEAIKPRTLAIEEE